MPKIVYSLLLAAILIGCGDSAKAPQPSEAEADLSLIKITQGEKKEIQDEVLHQKELEADKKGFYYAYSEDGKEENSSDETFTRVDAQRNVKNRVQDGKVLIKPSQRTIDNPYEYVRIDMLKRALSKDFMIKCSACHDDYANGIIGPSLLTKDGNFIYGQLIKYRNDPKKNVLMRDLVNNMTETELKSIAEEIALFNKEVRALRGME